MSDNSLFDQDNTNSSNELANLKPEEALDTLVGEGKKYATPAELALAYAHANSHIGKLQQENQQFREQEGKSHTIEELLEAVKKGLSYS